MIRVLENMSLSSYYYIPPNNKKCKKNVYYDEFIQLNLVCDNKWLPSFSTTLFYVGSLFGNLLFGWIADK
jgi:hypothetical protein